MEIIFIALLLFILLMVYLKAVHAEGSPKKKPCKPHKWTYCDEQGWIDEKSENIEERLKYAVLVCANCRMAPQQNSGSTNGEYE